MLTVFHSLLAHLAFIWSLASTTEFVIGGVILLFILVGGLVIRRGYRLNQDEGLCCKNCLRINARFQSAQVMQQLQKFETRILLVVSQK